MKKLLIFALLTFLFFGCVSSEWKTIAGKDVVIGVSNDSNKTPTKAASTKPTEISSFSVYPNYDLYDYTSYDSYVLTFQLKDDAYKNVAADGSAEITITDKNGSILLYKTFNVKASEFNNSPILFSDYYTYQMFFPKSEILNSSDYYSTGKMKFTTKDGTVLEKTSDYITVSSSSSSYSYPSYTDAKYTPITTDYVKMFDGIQVSFDSYGSYKTGSYSDIRADFNITNAGSSSKYLRYKDSALTYKGKQYHGYQLNYPQEYKIFPSATVDYSFGFQDVSELPNDKFTIYLEFSNEESSYGEDVEYTTITIDYTPK